jgi:hypothetical protein
MRPAARYPWEQTQPWWRRPGSALKLSLFAHAVLLAALYVFGSYRPAQLAVEARTAQSLSDTLKQAAESRLQALQDLERELARQPVAAKAKDEGQGAERRQALQEELRAAIEQAKRLIEEAEAAPDPSTEESADAPLDRAQSLAELAQSADAVRAALSKARSEKAGVGDSEEGAGVALFDSAAGELLQFEREMRVQADLSRHREQPMQFDGARPPLALDHEPLQQARGLSIGAGGTYANRLYLDRWHVIGPFEPGIGAPLQRAHPPEWAVALDGQYDGKGGRLLQWRYLHSRLYPMYLPDAEYYGVYYGYTEIELDRDRELWVWIGADDHAKLWINDRLVWGGGDNNKAWFYEDVRRLDREVADWNLSETRILWPFRKGRNRLLFKLHNGLGTMFVSVVLSPP